MKRGSIYYITRRDTLGAEIEKSRPAVVVSCDALNATSSVLEVVYLTTKPKKRLPTHATIHATGVESTALCEQVDTVPMSLFGSFCGHCSDEEMQAIDTALKASLGLQDPPLLDITADTIKMFAPPNRDLELARVTAERDTYKKILDKLLTERGGYSR